MPLYHPEKFAVHIGKGTSIGFCTVWNEPEACLKRAPILEEKCALIGTLYGRQGVSVLLRNLALNPSIRKLYLWGNGPLSNTKFGTTGSDVVKALWKDGVTNDGLIVGTNFRFESEVPATALRTIVAHVELVDVSTQELCEVANTLTPPTEAMPYMESTSFPEPIAKAPDTFPCERVGFTVHETTVIDAWKRVVQNVMRYGTVKGTQYGMPQKELVGVHWVVQGENPSAPELPTDWPQELCDLTGASLSALEEYYPVMLSPDAQPGTSYTYGNRLQRYPNGSTWLDQIEDGIIKQFTSSPDSRRGVATTLVPAIDMDSKEPPCLTQVQCLQSNGAIHLLATFRSHDIFKAAIPNAFALRKLQERVAQSTGFTVGALQITSQSAHIYEADWEQANKLIACAFTEREPSLVFDAAHADPRGNVIIRLVPEGISLTLMSSDGVELWNYTGASARACQAKLAQMECIGSVGHALDIGMELQKADIARQHSLPYTQDRPLVFPQ